MNSKKILQQAFKSVPEIYIREDSTIFIRTKHRGFDSTFAVLIANPELPSMIWTREGGWEKFNE